MTAEELDIALDLWARVYLLGDRAIYSQLSYPANTNITRYIQRGGYVGHPDVVLTPTAEEKTLLDTIDRVMATLRVTHYTKFQVVISRYVMPGPDESRAKTLHISPHRYDQYLYSARRYLRSNLLAAPAV